MLNELAPSQRRLIASFFLFGLATPMASTYVNTYLWRQSKSPETLAVFNIGIFIAIALGFLLNIVFLRRFGSGKLYALGCILQGLVPLALVSLGARADTYAFAVGLILGLAQGFYWANRNALTSKLSQGEYRYRFVSVETALGTVAGVISPLLIGWFIASGEQLSTQTIDHAYQVTAVASLILLMAAGALAWPLAIEPLGTKRMSFAGTSKLWKTQRVIEIVNGMAHGIETVLPLVIILTLLGQEGAVGTLKSAGAVFSAIVIVFLRKYVRHHHHANLFGVWLVVTLLGSTLFAVLYTPMSALIYFLLSGLVSPVRWSSFTTVMYEIVDQELRAKDSHRFFYIADREVFLNIGRVIGLLLLTFLFRLSPEMVSRYGLLLVALIPLPLYLLLGHTASRIQTHREPTAATVTDETSC